MSIYEYDGKKHMKQVKEEGHQEGLLEGEQKGRQEGLIEGRRELIRKKLLKGKSLAVIADELEEDVEVIQSLIEEIQKNNDLGHDNRTLKDLLYRYYHKKYIRKPGNQPAWECIIKCVS